MARTSINQRMFKLMADQGKHAADLCRILGVGTTQTTSWKNRGTDPPAKYILQIADFLEVSPIWLLTGQNDLPFYSSEEKELIRLYRSLSADVKRFVFQSVKTAAGNESAMEKPA